MFMPERKYYIIDGFFIVLINFSGFWLSCILYRKATPENRQEVFQYYRFIYAAIIDPYAFNFRIFIIF